MNFKTTWYERDFYELEEKNILSEISVLYGAYLKYNSMIDDNSSFPSYYEKNKTKMKEIFINITNRQIKRILKEQGIHSSGKKMRRLYYTGKNKIVQSYSWVDSFFVALFKQIVHNDTLMQIIYEQFLPNCKICSNESDVNYIYICCTKKILGFQYSLLNKFSKNTIYKKKKKEAKRCLTAIITSKEIQTIKESCFLYKEKKNAVI